MRNKKGFTLVELVIVIAVIAILAGVMIGTFASVVKKAKESAKMQEMTAQKQEQIANDIDQKLKNANWLGWEDFETKLGTAVADSIAKVEVKTDAAATKTAVADAVEAAFAKYASSIGSGNTGLTAEQVKYIVETALSNKSYSGVTAEQVKAIVNSAVSGTSTLTKAQVQAIVDAAAAKNLTLAQVTAAVTEATKGLNLATEKDVADACDKIDTALVAIKDLKDTALTEADIEALLAKYITNGKAIGDYSWYDVNAKNMTLDASKINDQLTALAIVTNGDSMEGQTVTFPAGAKIDLSETKFVSLAQKTGFKGVIDGNSATISGINMDIVHEPEARTGFGFNYQVTKEKIKDKVGYGFVDYLGEGGVIKNLTLDYNIKASNPETTYTYFGGVVGFLDGGTIDNVIVKGSIEAYNRVGGIAGMASSGTINNCNVSDLTIKSHYAVGAPGVDYDYLVAADCIAYVDADMSKTAGAKKLSVTGTFTKATTAPIVDANDKTTGNVKRGTVATIGYISKNVKGAGNTLALDLTVLGTIKCADTDDASNTERTYGTLGVVKLSEIGDKYTINGKAISTYGFSNN